MTQPVSGSQGVDIPAVPYDEHERECLEIIQQRDLAEDALGEVYAAVVGESPEWSNCFGYSDAINEIAEIHRNEKERRLTAERALRDAETRLEAAVIRVKAGMLDILAGFFDGRPVSVFSSTGGDPAVSPCKKHSW
jgi:hypothetical protein